MYQLSKLQGKKRTIKGEAPSARVFLSNSEETIIGMIAINVQLIISVYSLQETQINELLLFMDKELSAYKKLHFYIITKESFEEIASFQKKLSKAIVLQDTLNDFGKKFGVLLDDSELTTNLAYSFCIIDKEGIIEYVEYPLEISKNLSLELVQKTIQAVNFKPKGHIHENWMGS